ncbi:MAG: hypothetical protein HUU35_19450 [Armatimonadetes bacterium]|nr:hypothetical protein [Armatimonadota bacterium]
MAQISRQVAVWEVARELDGEDATACGPRRTVWLADPEREVLVGGLLASAGSLPVVTVLTSTASARGLGLVAGAAAILVLLWLGSRQGSVALCDLGLLVYQRLDRRLLAWPDMQIMRRTARHLHLRCGWIRVALPLHSAEERRFATGVEEAIARAKRRLAESEVVL